jgi:hypothetical protein
MLLLTGNNSMASPKFQPGQSGNLSGRPKNRATSALLRKSIADDMPEIIQTLIDLAKQGDMGAAKILIYRVIPSLRR